MTIGVKTDFVAYKRPSNKLRGLVYDLITAGIIFLLIILKGSSMLSLCFVLF